jgi:hypothetical protein
MPGFGGEEGNFSDFVFNKGVLIDPSSAAEGERQTLSRPNRWADSSSSHTVKDAEKRPWLSDSVSVQASRETAA